MINHISIKNFAIIENTEVSFFEGLNIITGETGAGKSIVIEAISLALGSRADSSYVRTGTDKATIQLVATLDGEDDITVTKVRRKITVYVNEEESEIMKENLIFKGEMLSVGGTYYPSINTLLFYYNVLAQLGYNVTVIGKLEEIPYKDDVIY